VAKAYSVDLRERVLAYLEKNDNKTAACQLFNIGRATLYSWIKQKKEKGHLFPSKRKAKYRKINEEQLKDYIQKHPDDFLSEIAEHFSVTPQAIFYALKRLKITFKKKHPISRKKRGKA
jgi:transposase